MVELAHGLGKQTIAEFVDDEDTLNLLDALGVDYAQGVHIGRPALLVGAEAKAHLSTGSAG